MVEVPCPDVQKWVFALLFMNAPIPRAGLTPRAKVLLPLFLVVLLGFSYFRIWRGEAESAGPHLLEGRTMGTTYKVIVAQAQLSGDRLQQLRGQLQAELDRIEALMSTYRPDSEVALFNKNRDVGSFSVSVDTYQVVQAAQEVAAATQGAFDITVRPLVAAWGFGAGAKLQPPDATALQAARDRVGHHLLRLEAAGHALSKLRPDLEIDLSAIAKGYGVDRLVQVLVQEGITSAMVEVGGEVRVLGSKEPGQDWRIGVESPDAEERLERGLPTRVVELRDTSIATSGDYRNYYERDGQRVSHTIDARSGKPIAHGLASVSVIGPSAMAADAWATALNVVGPEQGMQLAEREGLAAYFIVRRTDGRFEALSTPAFSRYLRE